MDKKQNKNQPKSNQPDINEIELINLENFGLIEGYDIVEINKRKANKTELFDEIINIDDKIQEKIQKYLEKNNYIIYGITKNKKIKGLYIFKEENNNLINIERIFTDEINDNIKNKYDKCLLEINKELVESGIYEKIVIGDNVLKIDQKQDKKVNKLSMVTNTIIGILFGYIIFQNIFIALIIGLLAGPSYTGIEVIITKKRGRKRKNK